MNLFDNTEKIVKFNRSVSQQLQIKNVLNPYTQLFIDVQQAKTLGILFNGYYRKSATDLIPLPIAASKGFIEFLINDQIDFEEMEIEYHSEQNLLKMNMLIREVYDSINRCMITFRKAIENEYLDTELFIYSCSDISMPIHEAFYCGFIIGEIHINVIEQKLPIPIINKYEINDVLYSLLKTIFTSLDDFQKMININEECELTSNGYIQHRKTKIFYLLSQAIQLGLVSFRDS